MENSIFSGRAQDYVQFRIDYPSTLKNFLMKEFGKHSQFQVADMGSGTGLLARWFLELGMSVYGVEPNEDMRREGERYLHSYKNFKCIKGSAEHSTLPDSSMDLVVAGNAFHWFDPEKSKKEFRRILKANGKVFLIRTDWKEFPHQRMKEYDRIVVKYCKGRGGVVTNPNIEKEYIQKFFSQYTTHSLGESETLYTLEQLKGRFLSTSYSPKQGHPDYAEAMIELETLFRTYEKKGAFSFGIIATIQYGSLSTN